MLVFALFVSKNLVCLLQSLEVYHMEGKLNHLIVKQIYNSQVIGLVKDKTVPL